MKPAFFPVILGGARIPFTPARLFSGGAKGAWYDPSDFSTLFQDSAGTTAVTAVEQPVGLMLDKSQGLVLGPELVITPYSGAATGGWGFSGNTITRDGVTAGGTCNLTISARSSATARAQITFTVSGLSGDTFSMQSGTGNVGNISTNGAKSFIFDTTSTAAVRFIAWGGGAGSVVISNISVKELPGNHASQATTASRPTLRARYNLLTYSEQLDNAAWSKSNATITANSVVAPDGTTTADLVTATNAADATCNQVVLGINAAGRVLTFTFYARCASGTVTLPVLGDDGTGKFWSNPATNKVTVTTDWQRFTVTGTAPALSATAARAGFGGFNSWSTGDAVYIWGADLRYGSSAGTYQRIAAATVYDTAGFLPYLATDGTDDTLSSGNIDLTGTSKLSAVVGATKNNDSNVYAIVDFGASGSGTAGGFSMWAGSPTAGGAAAWASSFQSSAGGVINIISPTNFAAPATGVVTTILDTVAAGSYLRVNGALQTTSATDPTDGTFGNLPLRLSRSGANGLPGRIYQLVVVGKTLSASEIASTEAFVNQKTGAF